MSQPIYIIGPVKVPRLLCLLCFLLSWLTTLYASAQCPLVCKVGLQVSLSPQGDAPITVQMIAPSTWAICPDDLSLQLFKNGKLIPNTLTCDETGITIVAKVRHTPTGNSCNGSLVLRDALPPQIFCRDTTLLCVFPTDPDYAGEPEITDNCEVQTFNYFDTNVNFPCGTKNNGVPVTSRIDRRWFASDNSNNSSTCIQRIWVQQATLADVSFPENRDGNTKPALQCLQSPDNLTLTGEPTIAGKPIVNFQACEVAATYKDSKIDFCPPAGYSLLRTWTVADFCGGNVMTHTQIIKVEDTTKPVLNLPAPSIFSTGPFTCTGTITLPQTSATDDCSSVSILPHWEFGNGYGPFPNVPIGDYPVIYTATDACGNQSSDTAWITVADQIPPQAGCSSSMQISLSSGGAALLNAAMLDAGCLDNCGAIFLDFALNGDTLFAYSDTLTCADIGTPLTATLRVRDEVGLENFCDVQINVCDFIRPLLACPLHITLTCQEDYTNMNLTGTAQAMDNCGLDTLYFTSTINLSACNTGTVLRTWFAQDISGNTRTCTQQIFMSAVSNVQVTFPPNVVINTCGVSADLKPSATGQPKITGQFCYPLSVTYTDELFNIAPPACFRIIRRWKVIDFCVYNPNGGNTGIWESGQIIDVRDLVRPTLTLPADITLSPDQAPCRATVNLQAIAFDDCSPTVTITHDSPFAFQQGADCSGLYPPGIHLITFTAADGCGNTARQTLSITVKDLTPPDVKCLTSLALTVPATGSIILQTNLLDEGTKDNCSPLDELGFHISPAGFSCQDTGFQTVVMRVTDLNGNTATCSAQVNVQDNIGACAGAQRRISGRVLTRDGTPVNKARIILNGDAKEIITTCDEEGQFSFSKVQSGNAYSIQGEIKENPLNGVSTYDLVQISKHILGLEALDNPYRMIAADANKSNTITTLDIVMLRRLILGVDTILSNANSWRFIPKKHVFAEPDNPFANGGFPEAINLNLSYNSTDTSGHDFIGIKVGDLNGSADAAEPRSLPDTTFLVVENTRLEYGKPVEIPILLPDWMRLEGFQAEISVDPKLASIQSIRYPQPRHLAAHHVNAGENGIAISWNNPAETTEAFSDPVVLMTLLPKANTSLEEVFSLAQNHVAAECYFKDKEGIGTLALQFGLNKPQKISAIPYPNPFRQFIYLPFQMPSAGEARLEVFDLHGRLVYTDNAFFEAGSHQWLLKRNNLIHNGLYGYRISGVGEMTSGKVVMREE
jgi:hypothetical protein